MRLVPLLACAFLLVTSATGCPELAPGEVGQGVARLSMRNVGAVALLLANDDSCGFASPAVRGAAVADEQIGFDTVTLSVEGCVIDGGDGIVVSSDCDGVTTTVRGRVTASATQTSEGILGNDPGDQIIPATSDSVAITIDAATFEEFEVETSDSDARLTIIEGSLGATLRPRLAVSLLSGECAVATPNVAITGVRYGPSRVRVGEGDGEPFEVDVAGSDLSALRGRNDDGENTIGGSITVFGSNVAVSGALDPDYDRAAFEESYACTPDLAAPENFGCVGDIGP